MIQQGLIATNWARYDSWDHVWGTARFLFESVTARLREGDRRIRSVELQYLDAFRADTEPTDADFRALIDANSEVLPSGFFDQGPYWHLHQGRFRTPSNLPKGAHRMLERMHLNSVRDTAGRFFVHFDLCHRFDLVPGLLPREAFIVNEHSVEAMYGLLHIHSQGTSRSIPDGNDGHSNRSPWILTSERSPTRHRQHRSIRRRRPRNVPTGLLCPRGTRTGENRLP